MITLFANAICLRAGCAGYEESPHIPFFLLSSDLAVLSIHLAYGVCYVNYDLFEGFKPTTVKPKRRTIAWHHVWDEEKKLVSRVDNYDTSPTFPTVTSKRGEINFTVADVYVSTYDDKNTFAFLF